MQFINNKWTLHQRNCQPKHHLDIHIQLYCYVQCSALLCTPHSPHLKLNPNPTCAPLRSESLFCPQFQVLRL